MAEVKFTKGPWEVAHAGVGRAGKFQITEHFVRLPGADFSLAADIVDADMKPSEANAHLIAASPALYEALKECIADLEECADELCAGPMSGLAATINKARAALALAEGKKE